MQVAVVATARTLATLCWHLVVGEQDYAFQRPSLPDKKLRALQLRAGMPSRRGQKGPARPEGPGCRLFLQRGPPA
jgi:transposase